MSAVRADWVVAVGVILLAAVVTTITRWKYGSKRKFRITLVIERDYEGPKHEDGDQPEPES